MKKDILSKGAITIVELIVVISILSILGTVWFMSYQNYNLYSRDVMRLNNINSLKSVLEYTYTETWKYPIPDLWNEITYSWWVAWIQWSFWEKTRIATKKLNKILVDPLTANEYTYSITKETNEYELGSIFEGEEVRNLSLLNIDKSYANNFKSYISWNYNWKVLKVKTGWLDYVLAIPSIIASDYSSLELIEIIENQKLSLMWSDNLPSSYGKNYILWKPIETKYVNKDDLLVWSWGSINELSFPTERLKMIDNIQKSYSGTFDNNYSEISKITLSTWTIKMKQAKDISVYILKANLEDPNYPGYTEPENICSFPITIWNYLID